MAGGCPHYLELHHAVLLEAAEVGVDDLACVCSVGHVNLAARSNVEQANYFAPPPLRTSSVFLTHCL